MILAVLLLAIIGAVVLAASASERPRFTPLLAVGGIGIAAIALLVGAVGIVGIGRGGTTVTDAPPDERSAPRPAAREVERSAPRPVAREVDLVVRPGSDERPTLDRLPAVTTRLLLVHNSDPVVVGQCVVGGPCAAGTPAPGVEGSALVLVELRRRIGGVDCAVADCVLVVTDTVADRTIATVRLAFGRVAPRVPAPAPVPAPVAAPRTPGLRADLPAGRLAAGLVGAAVLGALAVWLLRRRPEERPEDPFWGVDLDVPEWEDISLELTEDELAAMSR